MNKKIKKLYQYFHLDYCATEHDVEHSALNKTQKIQQKHATSTEKISKKLKKLKENKNLLIEFIRSGAQSEIKPKERKYEISLNSILILFGVFVFALVMCIMSFYVNLF